MTTDGDGRGITQRRGDSGGGQSQGVRRSDREESQRAKRDVDERAEIDPDLVSAVVSNASYIKRRCHPHGRR